MSTPSTRLRVAVCQIEYHPAYYASRIAYPLEPFIPEGPDRSLTFLASNGIPLGRLQDDIGQEYALWIADKTAAILKFLETFDPVPDLVLFPEYSIPIQILPRLKDFASCHGCCVLAGTHSYQSVTESRKIYASLGTKEKELRKLQKSREALSLMPVFSASKTKLIEKKVFAPFERSDTSELFADAPHLLPITLSSGVSVLPAICAEALADFKTRGDYKLFAIVACSDSPKYFDNILQKTAQFKRAAVLCNDARFGGSTVITTRDQRSQSWWHDEPFHGRLPKGESILIEDINLEALAVQVGVTNPSAASQLICLASVTYACDELSGAECSQHLQEISALPSAEVRYQELESLNSNQNLTELQALRVQRLASLARNGVDNPSEWNACGKDLVIANVENLQHLEARLSKRVRDELLGGLDASLKLSDTTKLAMLNLLTDCGDHHVNQNVSALATSGTHAPTSDIIDREHETESLTEFLDERRQSVCLVLGLAHIGKTRVIEKTLAAAGLNRTLHLHVHSTSSPEYVISEILKRRFPSITPPFRDIIQIVDSEEFQTALDTIDVIVITDAHELLRYRVWNDDKMHDALVHLFQVAADVGTKIITESRFALPFDLPDPSILTRRNIRALEIEDAIKLLDRELRRVQLGADCISPSQKETIVRKLGGHPVALSLCANSLYERGIADTLNAVSQRSGFLARHIRDLLSSLSLSPEEILVLRILSGTRTPIPREAIIAAAPFAAQPIVTGLISLCLIEVEEDGLVALAGPLKEHFSIMDVPESVQLAFHRHARDQFARLHEIASDSLAYAIEADYHGSLLGEDAKLAPHLLDAGLAAAENLYDAQRYQEAASKLNLLLEIRRTRSVLRLSALADAQCGSFDSALGKARESFASGAPDSWLLSELTRIALSLDRIDVADDLISTAKKARLDDVSLALIEGRLALRQRDIRKAENLFLRAIRVSERNAWPYFYLGRTYYREGRLQDAIQTLLDGERFIDERGVRNWNVLLRIRCLLCQSHLLDHDVSRAEAVLNSLIEEAPDDPEVIRLSAALALKRDGIEKAKEAFESLSQGKKKRPRDSSQSHLFLGLFYLEIDEPRKAIQEFQSAHRADRNNVYVLIKWAKTLADLADQSSEEPEIARGYARDCARIINRILYNSPENDVAQRLQHRLYSRFGIDTGDL